MLAKRIIPCLDIKDGRVVKGINFNNLIDAGDAVNQAKLYSSLKADELVFLDISATNENRKTTIDLVKEVAKNIFIPFTVGGGIKTIDDIKALLDAGADKVSINSAAVKNINIVSEASRIYGSQCIVVAVDTKFNGKFDEVFINGGKTKTGIKTLDWVREVEKAGAGEILLTSMDTDGVKAGFSIDITKKVSKTVNIPVIASGGAGKMEDFKDVFLNGADAALAASVFHFNEINIIELKKYLANNNITVRM